jgi:hypothetical protein
MKYKTQITAATLAIAASTFLVWSTPGENGENRENHSPTIAGVWQVTRGGFACNDPNQTVLGTFPALMTFHRDGTLIAAAKSPVTGPFDTPEFGTWQREPGSQNYSFRDVAYRYDSNGVFLGPLVVAANLELTSANSFAYIATIQIFNANGDLVASHCGKATATRF